MANEALILTPGYFLVALMREASETGLAANLAAVPARQEVLLHDHAGGTFIVVGELLDHVATVDVYLIQRHYGS